MNVDRKKHWEQIYDTKPLDQVSWYQPKPETSLYFFENNEIPLSANIIDIGGGDSFLVDYLIAKGYKHITVLDISEAALNRAKLRLGDNADKVTWVESDVTTFKPTQKYDVWHDRAAFHFLTNEQEIAQYIQTAYASLSQKGILIIGTFSEQGPTKCSGIEIKQYSESALTERFESYFMKKSCISVDHNTPFNTIQNFVFCSFILKA